MLKTLTITLITAANAIAVAVPALQPHEILIRSLPEFPAAFGYHVLPRQAEHNTATSTSAPAAASGSTSSAVTSTTSSASGAVGSGIYSSQLRSGCEETCQPWIQVIYGKEWRAAEATRSSAFSVDGGGEGPRILCENLDTASTCGFCNAGSEHKDEMTKGMQAIYNACKKQYRVPDNVQGVSGACARAISAAFVAGGIAAALLVQTAGV